MAKLSTFIGLLLSPLLVTAQEIESNRLLTADYQPQSVEQAFATLTATNTIGIRSQVAYKAGQSVVLQPGFEAKAGSVFTAHVGTVSLRESADREANLLSVSAYPNPFDEFTTITYVLTKPNRTSLQISDANGKLISQLVDERYQEAGRHYVVWKGNGIPAGTYICILDTGPQRLSKRIIRK